MKARAPKYRVSTVQAITKHEVLASFEDVLQEPLLPEESIWHCNDGSSFVFKPCKKTGLFYVELQCQFHALPERTLSFGLLPRMIEFCKAHGGKLRVLRNNSVLPASGGMYSDVYWSDAYKVARHLAENPNDVQAKAVKRTR